MSYELHQGDALTVLRTLPESSVQCCVTSPPYWGLRRYVAEGHPTAPYQIGLEEKITDHIEKLVEAFAEVRRVLRPDGVLWLNYGSMYSSDGGSGAGGGNLRGNRRYQQRNYRTGVVPGFKEKDLIMADAMLALSLQKAGWWLRSEIIWHKPTAMPESAKDRPMRDHEKVFLLSKSECYFYDRLAATEPFRSSEHKRSRQRWISGWKAGAGKHSPVAHNLERMRPKGGARTTLDSDGRLLRTVWTIASQPFYGAHFATFPPRLAERCVLLSSRPGDTVLDPFSGAGTTGLAACRHGRRYLGIELNPDYIEMARVRLEADRPIWGKVPA